MNVVIVQRWYMEDDAPTIIGVYSFERNIDKFEFLKKYPGYKDCRIIIEPVVKGE
jgi:hypothetical protein